jgi:hypothetical protein
MFWHLKLQFWTDGLQKKRGGQIAIIIRFATKFKNQCITSYLNVRCAIRIWKEILAWTGFHDTLPSTLANEAIIKKMVDKASSGEKKRVKAMASLIVLMSWEIWKK